MAKSRCKRGSRKCISSCVGKQAYRKIKLNYLFIYFLVPRERSE